MRNLLTVTLLTLALATPGNAVLAQDAPPGWIGIYFEVRSGGDRLGRGTSVVITDVRRGSPAEAAGIRAGDRLLAINDVRGADEFRNLAERLRLRVGDLARIQGQREGRPYDLTLRAAERPRDLMTSQMLRLSFQPDAMVETMFRAMDSLRLRLVEASGQTFRVPSPPRGAGAQITVTAQLGQRAVQAPFGFFLFRGEQHDSLRREMEEINRLVEDLRIRQNDRRSELRRVDSRVSARPDGQDEQLLQVRVALEEASRRSASLRSAMAEAARETAGLQYTLRPEPNEAMTVGSEPRFEGFRPLMPYLVGSNRVAGAQVLDLGPELAEYFQVEGGVLVVDVSQGTPAAIAGIRPGDVITRLDQVGVHSVVDLRFGVSQAGETLPIALIRQGSSIQVLLRRR